MTLNLKANSRQFLTYYLSVLSSLRPPSQQLSPYELLVLVEFALLPQKYASYPFSPAGKRQVLSSLSKKFTKSAFHAKIYSLLKKGYLVRDEDKVILIPPFIRQALQQFISNSSFNISLNFDADNPSS